VLTEAGLREVYAVLREAWSLERSRLELIRRYLRNEARDIYVPSEADAEYQMLVDQARFNILPLVVTTVAQGLFIDGYRPTGATGLPQEEQSPLWEVWQRNRMDSRQAQVYRPAIAYGTSYVTVLPGDPAPVLTPFSPWRCTALYADDDDEWPVYALTTPNDYTLAGSRVAQADRARLIGPPVVRLFDDTHVYDIVVDVFGNPGDWSKVVTREHGLGVCPVVRFRKVDEDGSASCGKIEPLLPLQRQINQITFSALMAAQFGAFRQRWATGMALDKDPVTGEYRQPFNASASALWASTSPDTKFGDFAETNLDGYMTSRDKAIIFASSTAQIPPHNLLIADGISNIAAETLAALESAHQLDVADYKTAFGEHMEQALRLAGLATGDQQAWDDISSEVAWRDTTPRSLGQLVDALGKMAAQLGIPAEELWTMIPGTTEQQLVRWRAAATSNALMQSLEALANAPVTGGQAANGQVPNPTGDAQPAGATAAGTAVPFG